MRPNRVNPLTDASGNDRDGCPDEGQGKVRVEGSKIVILENVHFATQQDVILARSFPLVEQVGQGAVC